MTINFSDDNCLIKLFIPLVENSFLTKKVWGLICALLCRGLKLMMSFMLKILSCLICALLCRGLKLSLSTASNSNSVWFVPCYVGDWNPMLLFETKNKSRLICALLCRGLKHFSALPLWRERSVWFVPCYVGDWNPFIHFK